jgi:hypothetical protein
MARQDYDRYEIMKNTDGTIDMLPFVPISQSASDLSEVWILGRSRLDKLALRYYNNPFYDVFILYANPQYADQFEIPDGALIRIPFPIDRVKLEYETFLRNFKES